MNATATVTSRGRVTLPESVRQFLHSRIIEFEVQGDAVLVRPVQSVAGRLATHAGTYRPLSEARDQAWTEVARGKAKTRSA